MRHKNRNTIFSHLTYERTLSHLHRLEEHIEAYRLPPVLKKQVPVAVCTMIEEFCRTKKRFMYGDGEPMPQELILNVLLVMDMLDWSDSWCVDNTRRHDEVLRKHVQDIANDGSFTISIKDLNTLIDEACDIRQPMLIESLAASALNFQSVEAVNSLDVTNRVLDERKIDVEEYDDLFERRHTHTHTLEDTNLSPRVCIALAKDLFEVVLGRDDYAFYSGRELSEAGRHKDAVSSLRLVRGHSDWKYLMCYGRSLAHIGNKGAGDVLHQALNSLLEHVKVIPTSKKKEAKWLRMDAARIMCDIVDGFRAAGKDYQGHVDRAFEICADSADAYWLATSRLEELGFTPDMTIKFSKKAHELADTVDTAYEVGMKYFKLKQYKDAKEWLKKAEKHDPSDMDVKLALERAENYAST